MNFSVTAATVPATARQKEFLEELLRMLPRSEPWERWLKATGEMPPDFDKLPGNAALPDPLIFANGHKATWSEWPKRREELLGLFQHYVLGSWPVSPTNLTVGEIKERNEAGAPARELTLEFGPGWAAKLRVEIIIPDARPPLPVFITQDTHRRWALLAVSRGYIACVYAGADSRDDTESWKPIWPGADWTTLTRRAWAASRCVDYLHTLKVVDKDRIAIAGHSRNGKTSLIAAAFDPRIKAVISSSSGAGGACSFRLFSETQFGEGIENITRGFPDWLHPRLRFFAGRENKLPVDQPQLIACIAPRPCLISSGLNDSVESIWAVEQTVYSARRAYELLERSGDLSLRYRSGGHETRAEDIEGYMDWLDAMFKRAPFPIADPTLFPTYKSWQDVGKEKIDPDEFEPAAITNLLRSPEGITISTVEAWNKKVPAIRERVLWGLGQAPPFSASDAGSYGAEARHLAVQLGRSEIPAGMAKRGVNFGNYIAGDLYFPTNADTAPKVAQKLPAVIWLHPISVSHGYAAGYRRGENPHIALARLGCAVFAFDQIGNGTRVSEVRNFYLRYPHWSLMGKQVEDTLAAVEALAKTDFVDPKRIWLLGYATGGMTALHAAALDDRVAGVVSVAGFTPMRLDTATRGTGGIARWSVWMPLQPRLAAFLGKENRIPYDYHELLGMIAPRPALIFAPKVDYQASAGDVRACVEEAGKVYDLTNGHGALQLQELDDYNHFSPETQRVVFDRLKIAMGL
ncbi:MAG: hypothetical protein QOF48_828 [Verrucomicrobiota bacterium]